MEVNKIYNMNAVDLMEQMEAESVDLTVTSPPYDALRKYEGYEFDFKKVADGLLKVTKPGGVVVWVVGDQTTKKGETGSSFMQALYFKEIGFNIHDTMIYKKNAIPYPDTKRYYSCFEYMFILSKNGEPKTFNPIQDRKNKHGNSKVSGTERKADGSLKSKPCKKRGARIKEYGYRWNVWDYNVGVCNYKDKKFAKHPATFPMNLAGDHIISWSNEGDLVFDPMAGSGTTPYMAKKLGRNYLGCDVSKEYIELMEYRLDDSFYEDNGLTYKRNILW